MEELDRVIEEVEAYKPSLKQDEEFQAWLADLRAFPRERREEQWLKLFGLFRQWVDEELEPYKNEPLYPDLPEEMRDPGGVYLGRSFEHEVRLPVSWLTMNLFAMGKTGSGKTNCLVHLIRQMQGSGARCWVIDFQEEYAGHLAGYGFTAIPWQDLKLNPLNMLDPVDVQKNARTFQRIFGHSQGLWEASQAYLGFKLHELYEQYESFQNRGFPTLHDLYTLIDSIREPRYSPLSDYHNRIWSRLGDILLWEGSIFDCQRGFPIEEMIQEDIVFDFRGLKDITKALVAESLMAALYEYWAARGKQDRLRNVLVSDEAKHLFNVRLQKRLPDIQPYVDRIMAETRKFGIALVLADHQATEITPSVAANSHITCILQLASGEDVNRAVEDAGLTERQLRQAYDLKQGQAIVKVSGEKPFRVEFPHVI